MTDIDPTRRKVTSRDVAMRAGVSRSAVSRTFTDGASVSEETKERVLKASLELGYRVNVLARSLHNQRSDLVGVVAADMDNPFRAEQIDCLSRLLRERGFKPILIRGEPTADVSDMIGTLLQYSVAGVVVTSDAPPEKICVECRRHGVPLVTINKQDLGALTDRVVHDFNRGADIAFDHLTVRGCSNLALVCPENASYTVGGRADAFIARCESAGLPVMRFSKGSQTYSDGLRVADDLAVFKDQIDGIFCVADYMALGVLDGLRHNHGIHLPKAMRLVGFDDIPQAAWRSYDMTTVRQSREDLAVAAVDFLCRRIEDPDLPPQSKVCIPELIIRST